MKKTGLLRIVSILFLIWSILNLLAVFGIVSCAGITSGILLGSVGAGVALGTLLQISSIVCFVFMLVAGIAGVNATNKGLCNFCAIIILISAIVTFIGGISGGGYSIDNIVFTLLSVSLPVLYFIGVKRAF